MDDEERLSHDEAQIAILEAVSKVLEDRRGGWHFDAGPPPFWESDPATRMVVSVQGDTVTVYDAAIEITKDSIPVDGLASWLDEHERKRGKRRSGWRGQSSVDSLGNPRDGRG
jgi:hypothetical protein